MPRPGPRPYECVRRAWHSDRHQPMRGSIIQQIFRLVTENHTSVTKKNKEWQEKLPIVVLKAEEIIYSKANSETEYMNLETLWDRANDAIDTIIRRDENIETREFLPPCIEAALNLGCVPVRASRSQRHSNQRTYLTSRPQETAAGTSRNWDRTSNETHPHFAGKQMDSSGPRAESRGHIIEDSKTPEARGFPFLFENTSPQLIRTEASNPQLNLGSVYPIYYGAYYQNRYTWLGSQNQEQRNAAPIFVGTPVGTTSPLCPAEPGGLQNLLLLSNAETVSTETGNRGAYSETVLETGCDLNLRLGLSTEPQNKNTIHHGINDSGSPKSKEFCFFPSKTANDSFESCSGNYDLEASIRKRKAPTGGNGVEDGQLLWQQEFASSRFPGRIAGSG